MTSLVIDASVAVKWFFEETYSDSAILLLNGMYSLIVSELFFLEIDNVLCKRVRRNEIIYKDALEVKELYHKFPFEICSNERYSDIPHILRDI